MASSVDVVVIGAGFAGLSAAVELALRGARVLVAEARPVLGGRATAFTDSETGEVVDNGQHVMLGCYRDTFRFLRAIGTEDHVRLQPDLEVTMIDRQGRRSTLRCPPLPAPFHLMAGVLEWEALGVRDRLTVLKMARLIRLAWRQARGADLAAASPGETVERWLVRNGQADGIRELLWEPLALAALNQSPREAAAPPFARVLAEMFAGGDRRSAAIGLPDRPLDRLYAEPARAFVEARGGAVVTSSAARVVVANGAVAGVEVRGERVAASRVIAAVPWFNLVDLVADPPPALHAILNNAAATAACPIVTVNLWLDRPALDTPFIGLPGRTWQWVFDKRIMFGGEAAHVSLVSSGAGTIVGLSNQELVALAVAELSDALPDLRRARIVRALVVREKRATFSLAPGQPPRPGTGTPIRGLWLAGDWVDTGLPGTIESAVVSGHRAAEAVT